MQNLIEFDGGYQISVSRDLRSLACTCVIGTPAMRQVLDLAQLTRIMKMLSGSANSLVGLLLFVFPSPYTLPHL